MKEVNYLKEVYRMLETKKYTRVYIARTMNVSERWVDLMRSQEVNPSYDKVITLYKLLKKQPDKLLKKQPEKA